MLRLLDECSFQIMVPSGPPRLVLGAPADEFDDLDDYVTASSQTSPSQAESASSKSKKQLKDGISWDTCNSDEDDLEEFLMGAPENQPAKRFDMRTTFSLEAKTGNKKKRRKGRKTAHLQIGIALPSLEDEFSSNCQVTASAYDYNFSTTAAYLTQIWLDNPVKLNEFTSVLLEALSGSSNSCNYFAQLMSYFKTSNCLSQDLFEKSFSAIEMFLMTPVTKVTLSSIGYSTQQLLFDSVCDLDVTPAVTKCFELFRLKEVDGNALVYSIQRLLREKKFKVK